MRRYIQHHGVMSKELPKDIIKIVDEIKKVFAKEISF